VGLLVGLTVQYGLGSAVDRDAGWQQGAFVAHFVLGVALLAGTVALLARFAHARRRESAAAAALAVAGMVMAVGSGAAWLQGEGVTSVRYVMVAGCAVAAWGLVIPFLVAGLLAAGGGRAAPANSAVA